MLQEVLPCPSSRRPVHPGALACHTLTTHLPLRFCPTCIFLFNQGQKGSKRQDNLGYEWLGLKVLKGTHQPKKLKAASRGS